MKLTADTRQSNVKAYQELKAFVKNLFNSVSFQRLEFGKLEINDFSICFGANAFVDGVEKGFYVKIPKDNLYLKQQKTIFPITPTDKSFALAEYESLRILDKHWSSGDIEFVKPVSFLEEYNAIITERVYGKDLLYDFRKYDIWGRVYNTGGNEYLENILFNYGESLNAYHKIFAKEAVFNGAVVCQKILKYCRLLQAKKVDERFIDKILFRIDSMNNFKKNTVISNTHKGLDVRNILMDKRKRLFILDPGKTKQDFIESDLARFIVTIRIIYWGTMLFFLRLCPDAKYEKSFIRGYYKDNELSDNKILSLLVIKELVKHWNAAHIALELKKWPRLIKLFLARYYINHFYTKQIKEELLKLKKEGLNGL